VTCLDQSCVRGGCSELTPFVKVHYLCELGLCIEFVSCTETAGSAWRLGCQAGGWIRRKTYCRKSRQAESRRDHWHIGALADASRQLTYYLHTVVLCTVAREALSSVTWSTPVLVKPGEEEKPARKRAKNRGKLLVCRYSHALIHSISTSYKDKT